MGGRVKGGRRYYWPDEEPESSAFLEPGDYYEMVVRRTCGFCGQEGHKVDACPHRPVS